MAERKISTRLVIEGENEYKSSIKRINAEHKTLESALKLVDSSFKNQANSMAALEAKNKALNDVIAKTSEKLKAENDALTKAGAEKTKYGEAAESARKRLEELKNTTDAATKKTEEYFKQVAVLQAEINKYEAAEQKAAAAVENHTTKANKAQVELNNLNGQLDSNKKYLNEAKTSADGCAKSIDALGKETQESAKQSEEFGEKSTEAIDGLASALAAAGVVASLKEIADALKACVEASIDFESAMAGVAKTTNLSQDELARMGESIKELTLTVPVTATEFAKIAEVAGQLGVAKENLLDFSTVMANLGVATNMTSDEAATMLAQFAAITGMDASNYDRLGSAIVALGNSFATNEQKITDMSQGIAGAGTNANISEADILALSAAVTSLGIETAAGSTSMSKLIMDMGAAVETGNGLTEWAKAAGMTASEFAGLWGTDATAAISAFIGNLDNLDVSAEQMLNTLGITETRMVRMVISLMNAEDKTGLLTDALNVSNSAWEENSALVTEAETRYKTTESKLTLFKNSVENLKIAVGDQLTPALQDLTDAGRGVAEWATQFIEDNREIVPIVTSVTTALGIMVVGITAITVVVPLATKAIAKMHAALLANPYMLVATAIAAIITAFAVFALTVDDGTQAVKDFYAQLDASAQAHSDAIAAIDEESNKTLAMVDTLVELASAEELSSAQKAIMLGLISDLNTAIPDLNISYDELNGTLNMTAEQIKKIALAEAKREKYKADVEALKQAYIAQEQATNDLADAQGRLAEAEKNTTVEHDTMAISMGEFSGVMADASDEFTTAQWEVQAYGEAVGDADARVAELEAAVNGYADAANGAIPATQGLSAETAASVESITASMGELVTAYNTAYDSALTSINNTINGFSEMAATVPTDIQTVMDALDSQDDFISTYMDNLAQAASMGLDEGLLAELSDGSIESANILQGIVDDGGTKIQELNEKFREVSQGKEDFATTVAEMQTDFATTAGEIVSDAEQMVIDLNLELDAYGAGADTIQGYIDGLNSKLAEVNSILGSVGFNSTPTGKKDKPPIPAHAQGIDRVPYDGYFAILHEDEAVLNRAMASEYRANERAGRTDINTNTTTVINHNSFFVPTKEAYDDIAEYVDKKWGNK